MSFIRIATAFAATAIVSPALAADLTEPAPINPWEFYVGAHAGVVWGNGTWEDAIDNHNDLDGTRGIFGALAGVNYRMDTVFVGLEADVGFATDNFNLDFFGNSRDGCSNGTWCDVNGHIRARLGATVTDGLDLFVAGGVALADGNGSDNDAVLSNPNNDVFVGWSLGAGVEYAVTEQFKLRVEYLYDDYGNRHPYSNASDYSSDWADNTVRAAAIFTF